MQKVLFMNIEHLEASVEQILRLMKESNTASKELIEAVRGHHEIIVLQQEQIRILKQSCDDTTNTVLKLLTVLSKPK